MNAARKIGLFLGPLAGAAVFFYLPDSYLSASQIAAPLDGPARVTMGLACWMAVWWITEAIPLSATALLPLAILPFFKATSMKAAASPYAHELIFLFMGGFLLALSMQRWNLHKRIAFVCLRFIGSSPGQMVAGFMIVTAVLSMWVSNTATAIMMLPISVSVLDLMRAEDQNPDEEKWRAFRTCLLLGIAYGASIGGVGTLIGTPPNLFLASYAKSQLGRDISFIRWMMVGIPLALLFLPAAWFVLTRVAFPIKDFHPSIGADKGISHLGKLGPMSKGEWATFLVFMTAALSWTFRPLINQITVGGTRPFEGLTDPGVAMIAALLLFVIPVDFKKGTFVMNWEWAAKLPWGLLILFGGGLSLAAAIKENGVGEFIASGARYLEGVPTLLLVTVLVAGVIFLTELTSNTATTATLVPILASLSPGLGVDPYYLIVPAAVAASCAFMLPVATPPNAVIFGSGYVKIQDMTKAGIYLNVIGIVLISALGYLIAIPFLMGSH